MTVQALAPTVTEGRTPAHAGEAPGRRAGAAGAAVATGVSLLLTGTGWGGLAVVLVVAAWVLVLPGPIGTRLLLAFTALTALASMGLLLATALHAALPAPAFCAVVAAAAGCVLGRRGSARLPAADVSGALLGAVLTGLTWRLWRSDGAELLSSMSQGEDHASHLSLLMGVRSAGAYLYGGSRPEAEGVFVGLHDYPQAVHGVAAVVSSLVEPAPLSAAAAVSHYGAAVAVAFALFVLAMGEAGAALGRRLGVSGPALLVAALLPVAVAVVGPFQSLFLSGFLTQLTAYVALLGLVVLALLPRSAASDRWRPWLACTALVTVAGTWYLVLPVAAVPAAWCVLAGPQTPRRVWRRTAFVLTVVAVGGAAHVVVSLSSGAAAHVNAPGGVIPVGALTVAVGVLAPLLAARWTRTGWRSAPVWWWTWGAAAACSLLLVGYQLATVGGLSYYSEKSLYTLLALSAVGAGGLFAHGIATTRDRGPALLSASLASLLLLPVVVHPGSPVLAGLRPERPSIPWDHVLSLVPESNTAPLLFWDFLGPVEDYHANRLLGAVHGQEAPARWAVVRGALTGQRASDLRPLVSAGDLTLLTDDPDGTRELLRDDLPSEMVGRIRVVTVGRPGPASP